MRNLAPHSYFDILVLLSVLMSKRGVPAELASARIPSYAFPEDAARALVEDLPEVVELDCNPVFVRPQGEGVVAVDVRMRVATRA